MDSNYIEYKDSDSLLEENNTIDEDLYLSVQDNSIMSEDDIENDDDNLLKYIEYENNENNENYNNNDNKNYRPNFVINRNLVNSENNINPYLDHLFERKPNVLTCISENIDDTRDTLRENIDKVIEREIKISNLEEKSESLIEQSENFKKKSKRLKITMCQKYAFHIISIIGIMVFIIILISILIK